MKYRQIGCWDCGATCIAYIANVDPDVVRTIARKFDGYTSGLDPYELEEMMDDLEVIYQPLIISELNEKFCDGSLLLVMVSPRKDIHDCGNHWILVDKSKIRDPIIGLEKIKSKNKDWWKKTTILRVYSIMR